MKPNYRLIEQLLREAGEWDPSLTPGFVPQPGAPQAAAPQFSSSTMGSQDINMLISMFEAALRSHDFNAIEMIKGQIRALVQQGGVQQSGVR